VGGGVALARTNDTHPKVHIAAPVSSTTTVEPESTTSTAPATTTTAAATTTTSMAPVTTPTPPFPADLKGIVSAGSDGVFVVYAQGRHTLISEPPGASIAYRVPEGLVEQTSNSVVVFLYGASQPRSLGDLSLVGIGVYRGDDVAITLDVHPDVLHDDARFVRLYDLKTGSLIGTKLSIAPGSTLDHVSIAGDLFALSGASAEGGPFVLYEHVDGSSDDSLPNIVAGFLGQGTVSNAVISPDGKRIAYILGDKDVVVRDVSGKVIDLLEDIAGSGEKITALDFDGRWVVASHSGGAVVFEANQRRTYHVGDATGISTIDRG
jgi:WD40 repeat protein